MNRLTQFVRVAAVGALAVLSTGAMANQLQISSGQSVDTSYEIRNTSNAVVRGGTYNPLHTVTNRTTNAASFLAYCIDPMVNPATTSSTGSGTYVAASLSNFFSGTGPTSNFTAATYVNQVARTSTYNNVLSTAAAVSGQAQVMADIQELYSWAYSSYVVNGSDAQQAAFGFALWEIMLQNGGSAGTTYGANTGSQRVFGSSTSSGSDAVDVALGNLLTALNTSTAANNNVGWVGLGLAQSEWNYTVWYDTSHPFTQTYLSVTPVATPPRGVPEPGSLALAGLALVGLGVARRRAAARR